jgi:hypothetical protein
MGKKISDELKQPVDGEREKAEGKVPSDKLVRVISVQ